MVAKQLTHGYRFKQTSTKTKKTIGRFHTSKLNEFLGLGKERSKKQAKENTENTQIRKTTFVSAKSLNAKRKCMLYFTEMLKNFHKKQLLERNLQRYKNVLLLAKEKETCCTRKYNGTSF